MWSTNDSRTVLTSLHTSSNLFICILLHTATRIATSTSGLDAAGVAAGGAAGGAATTSSIAAATPPPSPVIALHPPKPPTPVLPE